jgi:hypothetical protein
MGSLSEVKEAAQWWSAGLQAMAQDLQGDNPVTQGARPILEEAHMEAGLGRGLLAIPEVPLRRAPTREAQQEEEQGEEVEEARTDEVTSLSRSRSSPRVVNCC